jgi:cardiolipin synthase
VKEFIILAAIQSKLCLIGILFISSCRNIPNHLAHLKKHKSDYLHHNKVQLVRGGHEYFHLLEQMIDEAGETIHLQTYIFDEDNTGITIAEALIRAATRGVKVYILLDGYGSQKLSVDLMNRFKNAGIFFRRFEPLFKSRKFYLGRRLHHKVVVVDCWRGMVGGMNISDRYNDTPEARAWLDWALYVEGEVAPELEKICKSRLRLKKKLIVEFPRHRKPKEICDVAIRVNDWYRRKREIYRSYLRIFREATDEIIIMSAYFLPGRRFRKEIEKAVRRGVKIKVVLTGDADVYMIKYAERYIYRWLLKNNIEIYEYQKSVLHAKIAAADRQVMTVGSFNVNNLSAFISIELNLEVNNVKFATHVHQRLEEIIKKDCVKVTEQKFNKQFNMFARAGHKTSYEIFRFLFFLSTRQTG